jgi:GAF domain-containing protein/anti-sigma regulatory factor (Ser/Thr protein kinase)
MHPNEPLAFLPAPAEGRVPETAATDPGARARPPDLPALLQLILQRAMALIGASGGAILLWDDGEQALLTQAWVNQPVASRTSRIALGEGLSGTVAARRTGFIVNDYRHWAGARRAIIEQTPITASMAEPLLCQERLVGVINLHNGDTGRAFTERDGELLRLFADQAAIAIENVRLHTAAVRREAQLEALLRASHSVMAGLDLQAVLEQIAQEAARIADCQHVKLLLVDREARVLRVGVLRGITTGMGSGFPLPLGTGLSGSVAETGKPLYIADTQNDPRSLLGRFDRAVGLRTYLGLPIRGRDEVLGVLTFNTEEPREYSAEEVTYLQAFADQAAIAIENARLYAAEQRRREQLEAVRAVTSDITRELELDVVLQLIVQRARELGRASIAHLRLWDETQQLLVPRVVVGGEAKALRLGEGLSGTVAARRVGMIVNDFPQSPYVTLPPASLRHSAVVAEPLLYRDRLIGTLSLGRVASEGPFAPDDEWVLSLFAAQAAIAIENARLHATTVRRAEQLLTLNELSRSLTTTLEPQRVAREILRAVQVLLPDAVRELWTWDETAGRLSLIEIDGIRSDHPDIRYQFRSGEGLVGTAAATRQPVISRDVTTDPRVQNAAWAAAEGLVSGLVLPLIHLNRLQGTLCVLTRTPHEFTDEEMGLLRAFADQAAIAIENARLYQAVHQSLQDLRRAQDELLRTEKLRALGQLAAGMAHDLNNMLAAVLGQVELLKIRMPDPMVREALGILETAAADGAGIVRRIQDFARQRPAARLSPCRLAQVVDEAVEITRPRWKDEAERRGVGIRLRTALGQLPDVLGNPAEIREALTNLLINAIEAMPSGGEIVLEGAAEAEAVLLSVRDTGVGMSADVQAKIFEPFFTTKGMRGTGLGLSLVYGIMERHGGRIAVESAPGQGTVFTLRFQRAHGEDTPQPPAPSAALPRPGRILLVDDDDMVRTTVASLLRAVGVQVAEAEGGASALAQLRGQPVDLVVTDLGMPDMTGWEVAEAVKGLYPALPVILMTGWQDQTAATPEQRRHVDAVLAKPTRLEDLLRAMREVGRRDGR